jgi:hypothetical protein
MGASRWSAGRKPRGFLGKHRSGEDEAETLIRPWERRKALKGEAQECWERRSPKGLRI